MKESEMAETLGITKDTLTKYRKANLERGVHWDCKPGFAVEYLDAGRNRVQQQFGLEDTPTPADEVMGIVRGFPRNDRLIDVELEGRMVRCRVRNRELYVKGMEFPMYPLLSVEGAEMYVVKGKPRRKGRWR